MSTPTLADPTREWNGEVAALLSALDNHRRSVEAFHDHDADAVAAVYANEAVVHDPSYPEPLYGRDAVREDYADLFRSFPDIRTTIIRIMVSGSTMLYEMVLSGTNRGPILTPRGKVPPTHRPLEIRAVVAAEVDASGRYRQVRRYYDVAGMFRQLGLEA